MSVSATCMSVHDVCPQKPEEGVRPHGTRVPDGCEQQCGCWGPNLGPLEE